MFVLFGVQRSGIDFGRLFARFRSLFRSHFERFSASKTGSVSGAGKSRKKEQNIAAGGRSRALGDAGGRRRTSREPDFHLPRSPVKLRLEGGRITELNPDVVV